MEKFRSHCAAGFAAAALASVLALEVRADDTPLMHELHGTSLGEAMESAGLSLNGWVEVSAGAANNQSLLPRGFDYRSRTVALQQSWIRFERPLDGDKDAGFRLDWIAPGLDYRFTMARGLLDDQLTDNDGQPNRYGFDPVQMYGELKLGEGTTLKLGRFFGPYGVESIEGWSTPLVSRSYTFIYDPFTQTGGLIKTALSPEVTLLMGLTAGNDVFITDESRVTGDLGLAYSSSDQATNVALFAIFGSSRFDRDNEFNNPAMLDLVFDQQLTSDLKYSLEAVFGLERNVPGIGTARWYGAANYLRYMLRADTDLIARVEGFCDADGNRTGSAGTYWGTTLGVGYHPVSWLQLRPEARYDHHTEHPSFGDQSEQFSVTFDALARW